MKNRFKGVLPANFLFIEKEKKSQNTFETVKQSERVSEFRIYDAGLGICQLPNKPISKLKIELEDE